MAPLFNFNNVVWPAVLQSEDGVSDWMTRLRNWAKRKNVTIKGTPKVPTFSDNFATNTVWWRAGNEINIQNGRIEIRTDDTLDTNFLRADLDAETESKWILRFKYEAISIDANGLLYVYLSNNSELRETRNTTALGFYVSGNNTNWRIMTKHNIPLGGDDGDISNMLTGGAQTVWVELQQVNDKFMVRVYSDENYRNLKGQFVAKIRAMDYTGLRHICILTNRQGTPDTVQANIDDMKFYNGVETVETIPRIDDSAEYPNVLNDVTVPVKITGDSSLQKKIAETKIVNFSSDSPWNSSGTQSDIDIINKKLKIDFVYDGNYQYHTTDVGVVGNKFRLDVDIDFDSSVDRTAGGAGDVYIGLFSEQGTSNLSQDAIYIRFRQFIDGNGVCRTFACSTNNRALSSPSRSRNIGNSKIGKIYLSIVRLSSTKLYMMIYHDKARTKVDRTFIDEHDSLENVQNLRYFGVKNNNINDDTCEWRGAITDARLWNNIDDPVVKEKPSYSENFEGSGFDGWSFHNVNFGVGIDEENNRLKYNASANSNPMYTAQFDFEEIFGDGFKVDKKFCLHVLGCDMNTVIPTVGYYIGLSNKVHTENSLHSTSGANGLANLIYKEDDGTSIWRGTVINDSETNDGNRQIVSEWTEGTWSFVIKSDGETVTFEVYKGNEVSGIPEFTQTITDPKNYDYRYFTIESSYRGNSGGSQRGTVNEIKLWNGVDSINPVGEKITFGKDDVVYPSRVVSYNPIKGDYFGYVKVPEIEAGMDTEMKMYYGYGGDNPNYVVDKLIDSNNPIFEEDFSNDNVRHFNASYNKVLNGSLHISTTHGQSSELNIGSILSNFKWLARFKLNITSIPAGSYGQIYIGLYNYDHSAQQNSLQDGIGMKFEKNGTIYRMGNASGNNKSPRTYPITWFNRALQVEVLYVEIIRKSRTLVTINLYSDEEYSSLLETQDVIISEHIYNLSHFKVMSGNVSSGNIYMEIDDLSIWDSIDNLENVEDLPWDNNYVGFYEFNGNNKDWSRSEKHLSLNNVEVKDNNNDLGYLYNGNSSKSSIIASEDYPDIWQAKGHVRIVFNAYSIGEGGYGILIDKKESSSSKGWRIGFDNSESNGKAHLAISFGSGEWDTELINLKEVNVLDIYYYRSLLSAPTIVINGIVHPVNTRISSPFSDDFDINYALSIGNRKQNDRGFDGIISHFSQSKNRRSINEAVLNYVGRKDNNELIGLGPEETQES